MTFQFYHDSFPQNEGSMLTTATGTLRSPIRDLWLLFLQSSSKAQWRQKGSNQRFIRPALLTVGLLSLCLFRPAHADLVFCNSSGSDLHASFAYDKGVNGNWTALGHYKVENNDCRSVKNNDLDRSVYYYAQLSSTTKTHYALSGGAMFCVDRRREYETVWDGDRDNPYYKDLELSNPTFKSCDNHGEDYEEVGFIEITASDVYDHCVVILRRNGGSNSYCWD